MIKYDWERWFRLRRFQLRRGEDYDCSQSAMSQQVRNAASQRSLRVSIVEGTDRITVLVADRGKEESCPA